VLRTIFVLIITVIGVGYALRGPFHALLFYLWIAYFRPDTWVWDPTLLQALNLSFTAGVYLLLRSLPSLGSAPFDLRAAMLLLFLLLSGLSASFGLVSAISWDLWIDFGKTLAVSYLVYVLASGDIAKFRLVLIVIAFSLGFEAAKQGYANLILNPGGLNQNRLPHLGDNNGVAVGMLMLSTVFLALMRTTENKWLRRLHLFFFVGVLYRGISTYSRGAFLALGALVIVYILRSNQKMKALVGAVLIALVVIPSLPPAFWERMGTMAVSSEDELDTSSASRLHFWRVAVDMANDYPLLGVGYNTYNNIYDRYDFSVGFFGMGRSVHSMWFGVLAELGYPALILYILMIVLAVTGMNKVAKQARDGLLPMEFYHYAVAIQTAFASCVVGGSFLPWQYTEMLWHFIALSMALRVIAMRSLASQTVEAPIESYATRRTA
jgi:putative inorganic carbon (HCO3(-)) transporter